MSAILIPKSSEDHWLQLNFMGKNSIGNFHRETSNMWNHEWVSNFKSIFGSFCDVFIEKKYLLSFDYGMNFPNFSSNLSWNRVLPDINILAKDAASMRERFRLDRFTSAIIWINTHEFISFLQDGENAKKRANNYVIVTFIHGTRVLWSKV